jgi:hypothetical protein
MLAKQASFTAVSLQSNFTKTGCGPKKASSGSLLDRPTAGWVSQTSQRSMLSDASSVGKLGLWLQKQNSPGTGKTSGKITQQGC